jgi:hypothetical protein
VHVLKVMYALLSVKSLWELNYSICLHFTDMCLFEYLGGGYVISPVNQGRQSVVKHMLAIDWKFWKSYLFTSSAKYITIRMLGRVAGMSCITSIHLA